MTADRGPLVPSRRNGSPPDDRCIGNLRPAMWQPTCHCPWSGGGGIRAITCVHLFSLIQVGRLVLSDLVPFARVIDIMKLLYLFQAEMPSESSIHASTGSNPTGLRRDWVQTAGKPPSCIVPLHCEQFRSIGFTPTRDRVGNSCLVGCSTCNPGRPGHPCGDLKINGKAGEATR
jgi:hypothetical protein